MRELLKRLLPVGLRRRLRGASLYETLSARKLARTSKRLDLCAAQFAHLLHLADHAPLEGKTCLEVGAGWVLTHALVCHLLGARKVIATDLLPHARPETLVLAIRQSIGSVVRDLLAPFSDHAQIRQRLSRLQSRRRLTLGNLRELGIEYLSPVDLTVEPLAIEADFIYSLSVLEHVPRGDVPALLANLGKMLAVGGTMVHVIHLEDHQDLAGAPFAFLDIPGSRYGPADEAERGNRIRASEWLELMRGIRGTQSRPICLYHRGDHPLPAEIAPSVRYVDEEDLRCSHLATLTRK